MFPLRQERSLRDHEPLDERFVADVVDMALTGIRPAAAE